MRWHTLEDGARSPGASPRKIVPLTLTAIGVVSCLVPARRALRVDPIKALRAS